MEEDDPPTFSSVVSATNRNLSRLSRNVALTASAVMSGSDQTSFAAPSAYHRAMSEVATYKRRLVASKIKENTPRQAIRETVVARLGGPRAPQIAEELLRDLPPPRATHSLFQNFGATTTTSSPNGESEEDQQLKLAVRKEMAASELVEIDERIAQLRAMRKIVFDRMADVERIQSSDEPSLQHFYPAGERIKSFTPRAGARVDFIDFNSPFGQLALVCGDAVELHELNVQAATRLRGTEALSKTAVTVRGADPVVTCGAGNNVYIWRGGASPDNSSTTSSSSEDAEYGEMEPTSLLLGHVGQVLAVSDDGDSVVSSSEDKTVRHWDERLARCVATIDSFEYGSCLCLQHVGTALATGFEDGVVRLWDLRANNGGGKQKPQRELVGGHRGPVAALHFAGLELVSGSRDGSVRIWDLRNGQISHAEAYAAPITSLSFDATKIVTAVAGERGVRVLSRATHEHRITASGDSPVTAAQYMKGYLVTGRESGEIGVYAV